MHSQTHCLALRITYRQFKNNYYTVSLCDEKTLRFRKPPEGCYYHEWVSLIVIELINLTCAIYELYSIQEYVCIEMNCPIVPTLTHKILILK